VTALPNGQCVREGVLSVSGLPELATTGKVAVGIGLKGQKPEILVYIRRVKAEGHELAAGRLNLATVDSPSGARYFFMYFLSAFGPTSAPYTFPSASAATPSAPLVSALSWSG